MKTTTTLKAMMAMAFATIAMTASANTNPKGNTWRNPVPAHHIEVRHDNRHHHMADWRTCRHIHIDRYGNRTFCRHCGLEIIWRGDARHGRYEVIPPRPMAAPHHHHGAPVPPAPHRR